MTILDLSSLAAACKNHWPFMVSGCGVAAGTLQFYLNVRSAVQTRLSDEKFQIDQLSMQNRHLQSKLEFLEQEIYQLKRDKEEKQRSMIVTPTEAEIREFAFARAIEDKRRAEENLRMSKEVPREMNSKLDRDIKRKTGRKLLLPTEKRSLLYSFGPIIGGLLAIGWATWAWNPFLLPVWAGLSFWIISCRAGKRVSMRLSGESIG